MLQKISVINAVLLVFLFIKESWQNAPFYSFQKNC